MTKITKDQWTIIQIYILICIKKIKNKIKINKNHLYVNFSNILQLDNNSKTTEINNFIEIMIGHIYLIMNVKIRLIQ